VFRLGVLSDIHGNLPALESVLKDANEQGIEWFIQAGDYTAGPQAVECIEIQRNLKGWMVLGNGEISLRRYRSGEAPAAWNTDQQFSLLRWDLNRLNPETLELLDSLPEQEVIALPGCAPIRVVHGSPRNPYEEIFVEGSARALKQALSDTTEAVLICGHTHIPWKVRWDGRLALNPGAVCGPLNGFKGTQYAILSWEGGRWEVEHRALRYDLEAVRRAFVESGVLKAGGALAQAFLLSIESGRNVAKFFLEHAYHLAEESQGCPVETIPDETWELAEATFDWKGVVS
jgi:putative phosphoesterase